jgi:hypothetical protein
MTSTEVKTREAAPPPGTPEFDEFIARQSQAAWARAHQMWLVRIAAGVFCLLFGMLPFDSLVRLWSDVSWSNAYRAFGDVVVYIPVLIELGSIALRGRSRWPVVWDIFRRNPRSK